MKQQIIKTLLLTSTGALLAVPFAVGPAQADPSTFPDKGLATPYYVSGAITTRVDNLKTTTASGVIAKPTDASGIITNKALVEYVSGMVSSGLNTAATLDTTSADGLSPGVESLLSGTVELHKISKTGSWNDLLDQPELGDFNYMVPCREIDWTSGVIYNFPIGQCEMLNVSNASYNVLVSLTFDIELASGTYTGANLATGLPAAVGRGWNCNAIFIESGSSESKGHYVVPVRAWTQGGGLNVDAFGYSIGSGSGGSRNRLYVNCTYWAYNPNYECLNC